RAHPFECSEGVLCSCAMDAAPDGSPVGLYARLPEMGEGEVVAAVLPAGASLLELGCGAGRITQQLLVETGELRADECGGCGKAFAVRRNVEPAARAGRVGERHDRRSVQLVPLADARRERREAEQPAQREPADGDDQARPQ